MTRSIARPLMVIIAAVLLSLPLALSLHADKPVVESKTDDAKKSEPVNSQVWRTDPACQLVFFAVLEGLYTDGVPDEVVDLIVPPKTDLDSNVKQCFVFRCPICHAAYEAFVLYQRRQGFVDTDEKKSTFGKNFDAKIWEGLKADRASTRVLTMGSLIRPWIEKRMKMQNLGAAEQKELLDKLLKFAADGDSLFRNYKADKNSIYSEWTFYGGCQACEAAKIVAKEMQSKQP